MTRQEFIENVNDWYDLKDFCRENDCELLDDVYYEDDRDEEIDCCLRECVGDYSWEEIRDFLNYIPNGYGVYLQNGAFDWDGLDDSDLRDYKENVIEWMDDGGYWDDDDDEERYDDNILEDVNLFSPGEDDNEDDEVAEEDFSVDDLIGMCSITYVSIQQDAVRREREDATTFDQFISTNMPKILR